MKSIVKLIGILSAIMLCAVRILAFEVTPEVITNMYCMEVASLHMQSRLIFSQGITNGYFRHYAPLFAKKVNVTEEELSIALLDFVEKQIQGGAAPGDSINAMRFMSHLEETATLQRLLKISTGDFNVGLKLPLASTICIKSRENWEKNCLHLVNDLNFTEKKSFYIAVRMLLRQEKSLGDEAVAELLNFVDALIARETHDYNLSVLEGIRTQIGDVMRARDLHFAETPPANSSHSGNIQPELAKPKGAKDAVPVEASLADIEESVPLAESDLSLYSLCALAAAMAIAVGIASWKNFASDR